jgi:hypothetical protein
VVQSTVLDSDMEAVEMELEEILELSSAVSSMVFFAFS